MKHPTASPFRTELEAAENAAHRAAIAMVEYSLTPPGTWTQSRYHELARAWMNAALHAARERGRFIERLDRSMRGVDTGRCPECLRDL